MILQKNTHRLSVAKQGVAKILYSLFVVALMVSYRTVISFSRIVPKGLLVGESYGSLQRGLHRYKTETYL